jgi:hypothetical protein
MKNYILISILFMLTTTELDASEIDASEIKVATFNVSMEALNYVPQQKGKQPNVSAHTLVNALATNHQQIRNIAEIIQRVNPDIILLNEFDNGNNTSQNDHDALLSFIKNYLNKSQNGQKPVDYKYFYQGPVNTGVNSGQDFNNNGLAGQLPEDAHGYGHFPGHFAMALLSKYPIDADKIRTFQKFKWKDMPGALKPINPQTNKPWYNDVAWNNLRLSSKSHWDITVSVNGTELHILASHPTPPVFDGKEDRNGKRNHDEIRFWNDYITSESASYIYDDKGQTGGLDGSHTFIILGDQNASVTDGDAVKAGIDGLLTHSKVQDVMPQSNGALEHSPNNKFGEYHTAFWRMRADYVLPSKAGIKIKSSGVFWPKKEASTYRLIKDRSASSDHRLVWVSLELLN